MIPIKLTMQAFGPYKEKETIDFSKFFEDRLFLIAGNTGSGKTMIFDAMCYALFGQPSGEYRDASTLRSQFAAKEDVTYVEFEFSHRNKKYTITRFPEQYKISRSKEVLQRASAQIIVEDELINGIKNVDQKIKEVLGIDRSQFKQIVMIAQGEFRELVSADSKKRESIYRNIFNTEEFKNIQNILKEKSLEYEKKFENSDQRIRGFLESINSINKISYDDFTIDQILSILSKDIEDYEKKLEELKPRKEDYKNKISNNNNFLESINSLVDKNRELMSIDISSLKDEVEFLNKAKKTFLIRDKERILENFKETRSGYTGEKEKIISDLDHHKKNLEILNKEFEEIKFYDEEIEKLRSKVIDIESLKDTVNEKENLENKIKNLENEISSIDDEVKLFKTKLDILNNKHEEMLKFNLENRDVKDKIVHIETELLNTEEINEGFYKYECELGIYGELLDKCKKCEDEYNKISTLYEEKLRDLSKIEDIYFRNQAGFLAKKLEDGSPCIVCGSTVHPNKATLIDSNISEDSFKKSRDEISKIEKEREKIVTDKINLNKDVSSKANKISEIYDEILKRDKERKFINFEKFESCKDSIEQVEFSLAFLKNLLKESKGIYDKFIKSQDEILNIEGEIKEVKLHIDEYEKIYIKKRSDVSALNTILSDKRLRLLKYNILSVSDYSKILKQTIGNLESLINKRETINSSITKCNNEILKLQSKLDIKNKDIEDLNFKIDENEKIFIKSLNSNEFKDVEEYQKFKITEDNYNNRNKFIEDKREEYKAIKLKIKELERGLDNAPYKNRDELFLHIEDLTNNLKEIEECEIKYHKNKSLLENVHRSILEINKDILKREKLRTNLNELNKIANGNNSYKISFERYILGIYFKEIIQAANIRLLKLTNGRFLFRHLKESIDMRSPQGLEISVFDNKTSQERRLDAVSGGESFQASLALALGLSDVVQRYSGGVSIDTLFIDEGFGSLDSDSLQNALECLIDANDESKLIGIISHVQELKDFIKSKIEVIDSNSGSSIKISI
ncbi:AAA family ATPase [Candidatus Arthromitus sp. SFB-rat-Yit]|uniref:AAA family ATPase n=1 Tax=Candidatus Arthromitus sp. SFB-rat-Yit TaxID=1041504 RepID=UPI000227A47B|nr:AAA family ATPase [Candidatus Arthromitus sp. SFB-rat-Yit]BAK81535.1 exonuclease SbcC [Candidatus Arthromitus sp. SFB-rat-Yit]